MKIKIINASNEDYWYSDRIGEIFEADLLNDKKEWYVKSESGYVDLDDATPVVISKDKYCSVKHESTGNKIILGNAIPCDSVFNITESNSSTDPHYNNDNGSLYKFATDHGLNAFEFDCIKRIVRCRKKGQWREDLEKTKRVIDLYLKEFDGNE